MPAPIVAAAGLGLAGAAVSANAASKAAKAQGRAADAQIGLQREIYQDQTERFAPFLDAGGNALAAYNYELGLGAAPTFGGSPLQIETIPGTGSATTSTGPLDGYQPGDNIFAHIIGNAKQNAGSTPETYRVGGQTFTSREDAEAYARANSTGGSQYQGISMSPAAQFALTQGRDTVEAGAAARGGLNSGATLAGLEKLRMGMAAQDRDNQLNRLAGMVDMGQGAAGMQASAGNAFAGMASTALANQGNAAAAGAIGQGNAIGGALGNLGGVMGYQNALGGGAQGAWAPPAIRPIW